jgi:hypothetical protein
MECRRFNVGERNDYEKTELYRQDQKPEELIRDGSHVSDPGVIVREAPRVESSSTNITPSGTHHFSPTAVDLNLRTVPRT